MSAPANNVCTNVVPKDLCIGCGVCAGVCPTGTLEMRWSDQGLRIPIDHGQCSPKCTRCLQVCPFVDSGKTEDEIAEALYGHLPGVGHRSESGYYISTYWGYSTGDTRTNGASGGLATWFLQNALRKGIVDRVVCVRATDDPDHRFAFEVFTSPQEVGKCGKSAYYPVDVQPVIQHILRNEGRYAIIGLPCLIKSLRLAQERVPLLKRRIVLVAGLVCGQTKSKFFSEYLLSTMGLDPRAVTKMDFRAKRPNQPASNFEARAYARGGHQGAHVWTDGVYGRTWHTGEFTPLPCTLCDDVFAETADVVFMDAWLPEFIKDSQGTNLVIARSRLAGRHIEEGISSGEIVAQPVDIARVVASQAAVVTHKRGRLANRLWLAQRKGLSIRKRVKPERPNWIAGLMLQARESLRRRSHEEAARAVAYGAKWGTFYRRATRSNRFRLNTVLFPGNLLKGARRTACRCMRFLGLM